MGWATIVPRDEWAGDLSGRSGGRIETPSDLWVAHHGASGTSTIGTARSYVKYHVDTLGWRDGGYNFVIAEGKSLELRGANRQGAHAARWNHRSHGICIAGDYRDQAPADRDLDEFAKLVADGVNAGWWPWRHKGHTDLPGHSTSCPARVNGTLADVVAEAKRLVDADFEEGVVKGVLLYADPTGSAWDWNAAAKAVGAGERASLTGSVEVARDALDKGMRVVAVGPDAAEALGAAEPLVGDDRHETLEKVIEEASA